MLKFVLKGILRDRSRSLFPIIVVSLIVALVIFNRGFLVGTMNGMFKDTAVISSGHVKIMTHAYQADEAPGVAAAGYASVVFSIALGWLFGAEGPAGGGGGSNELGRKKRIRPTNGACPRPRNTSNTRGRRSVQLLQRLPVGDHREKRKDEGL